MMRLIDNDKPDTPRARKAITVIDRNSGVVSTMPVRPEAKPANTSSRAASTVSPVNHAHANAERSHRRREVIGLVSNERTQRIDKDARTPTKDRLARGVHMEDERLATPRPHNSQTLWWSARASSASTCARCGWFEPIKLWISERVSSV